MTRQATTMRRARFASGKTRRPERELPVKNPWRLLALGIIREAQRDLNEGPPHRVADAGAFLAGAWFEQLAEFADLNPDYVRRKLLAGAAAEYDEAHRVAVK